MKIELEAGFAKKISGAIERYEMEVGILEDRPHRLPVSSGGLFQEQQLGSFAGGPVRKTSREKSDQSVGDVLIANMKRLRLNILLEPFKDRGSDILRFTDAFLRMATSRGMSLRRVENLLQAIVRNPILKGKYGANRASTADAKGFDRHLIDTGQMFKGIKARVKNVRR